MRPTETRGALLPLFCRPGRFFARAGRQALDTTALPSAGAVNGRQT